MKKLGTIAPVGFTLYLPTTLPEMTLKSLRSFKYYFKCIVCGKECCDLNNRKNRKVCGNDCRKKIPRRKWSVEEKISRSEYAKKHGYGKWMKGKKIPIEVLQKRSDSLKEFYKKRGYCDQSLWESKQDDYFNIHHWLIRKFGKAVQCDFCGTKKGKIEWSKLKHKKHARIRSNYWQLCRSCHIKYDRHDNLFKKNAVPNHRL